MRYRVTGRIRLGPGDTILVDDAQADYLKGLGVIDAEPVETLETKRPEKPQPKEE